MFGEEVEKVSYIQTILPFLRYLPMDNSLIISISLLYAD